MAVADLGNGHPDIVTANLNKANGSSGNTISVLLGNGNGTFQPAQAITVGSGPDALAIADFTGDGRPDIAVADYHDNKVSVLLGNGDGTFKAAKPYAISVLRNLSTRPVAVVAADVNGDGHPDIITANQYGDPVSVLLGDGNGAFQPAKSLGAGIGSVALAVADLGNGRSDIVTTNVNYNTVSVFLNQGDGQFQAPSVPSDIPGRDAPQLADFTGDGIPDAVSLNQRTGQIFFRQGTGNSKNVYDPLVPVNSPSHPAIDFTVVQTPGLPEIAALDFVNQQVDVYAWSSSVESFQEISSFATGPQPVRIASADLDGNGRGCIVVANDFDDTVTIGLQQSTGSFDTFTRSMAPPPPVSPSTTPIVTVCSTSSSATGRPAMSPC